MDHYNRRSIRLKRYDYSNPGAYFVTICCANHQCSLGRIDNQIMKLSPIGKIVKKFWQQIPNHFDNVELDEFMIMPDHLHGIIIINDHFFGNRSRGEVTSPLQLTIQQPTLGKIIAYFKYQSTKHVNKLRRTPGTKLWQRNYYERSPCEIL